jgi:hypothetical protein
LVHCGDIVSNFKRLAAAWLARHSDAFAGTRDQPAYPVCIQLAKMSWSRQTFAFMSLEEHYEPKGHGDFWSQAPVVLFTLLAIGAIVAVNAGTHAASHPDAAAAAVEVRLAPVGCSDCGEVVGIKPANGAEVGAPDPDQDGVVLEIRMTDGSIRTVKQFSPSFDVGDQVQVNGNALVARN